LLALPIALLSLALLGFGPAQQPPQPGGSHYAHPPIHVHGKPSPSQPKGYTPSQIRQAYGIDQLTATGKGQTIAIVEAYGSPTIQHDLDIFDGQFGLRSANLTIAYPQGQTKRTDSGWALETSLDVEWVHALAPDANILLVVAKSNSFADLMGAVDYATSHGAHVVSMSWGGSEFSGETGYDKNFSKSGVVFTASSGDSGSGTLYPAASPYVVGVGGTTLTLDSSNNWASETAWSGSGGGTSGYESEPSYQSGYGISSSGRDVPDVSFDADPSTGVAVYDSAGYQGQKGWFQVGGTSFGAPAWAALFALADQGNSGLTDGHGALYGLATSNYGTDYHDITSGSNGYPAGTGYDLVTGLGSPVANNLVPALPGYR
jgi:subtilase family serine protease